jgi:hypothetical protein
VEDSTDGSDGKQILGLRFFDGRISQRDTANEIIFRDGLVEKGEGLIRFKKKRQNHIREDDPLLKRDKGQSLGKDIAFWFIKVSHRNP